MLIPVASIFIFRRCRWRNNIINYREANEQLSYRHSLFFLSDVAFTVVDYDENTFIENAEQIIILFILGYSYDVIRAGRFLPLP